MKPGFMSSRAQGRVFGLMLRFGVYRFRFRLGSGFGGFEV